MCRADGSGNVYAHYVGTLASKGDRSGPPDPAAARVMMAAFPCKRPEPAWATSGLWIALLMTFPPVYLWAAIVFRRWGVVEERPVYSSDDDGLVGSGLCLSGCRSCHTRDESGQSARSKLRCKPRL